MKLLLISVKSDTPTGGIAVWTNHFLTYCEEQNIDCHLINTEVIGKRRLTGKRNLLEEGVRTYRIFANLRRHLRQNRYDAVYLNTSCGSYGLYRDRLLAGMIKRKAIPLVTQYHCDIPYWIQSKLRRVWLKHLVKSSQKNLVLNKASQSFLATHYHTMAEEIPNFIDSREIRNTPKDIRPTIRRVFYAGRITETKGLKELFSVAEQTPSISYDCAGAIAPICAQWDVPANVHLLGLVPHEQITRHLDEADVFLFPSHTEGSSMAIIESLARGVPTIATAVGNHAELLSDGCGILVDKGDATAMVDAIHSLDDAALRADMSALAIERIRCNYTEDNVKKIIAILQDLTT